MAENENYHNLKPLLSLEEVQETYRVYGLGGLTDFLNEKARDYNVPLMDLPFPEDDELDEALEKMIPFISESQAYDLMREMERETDRQ